MILEDIAGKRVVVTAGASGIGKVIATRFAAAGAKVHTCDVAVAQLAALRESHPEITTSVADVSAPEDVRRLFENAVESLGGLDILVNNAGVAGPDMNTEDIDFDSWSRTLDVNLSGTFLCTQHAIRLLKQGGTGGSIVNISSNVGLMGLARRAPYVASKWALIGLTRTMSLELGPFGIRVNAICPGDVEGERIARVILMEAESRGVSRDQVVAERVEGTALRTFISPHDVAALALFVCSDAGARISGQALAVDGHVEHL
jgi:NAD(P)-dependent dehydrogenase (short-subunit alcohol dehydrogenase family)